MTIMTHIFMSFLSKIKNSADLAVSGKNQLAALPSFQVAISPCSTLTAINPFLPGTFFGLRFTHIHFTFFLVANIFFFISGQHLLLMDHYGALYMVNNDFDVSSLS